MRWCASVASVYSNLNLGHRVAALFTQEGPEVFPPEVLSRRPGRGHRIQPLFPSSVFACAGRSAVPRTVAEWALECVVCWLLIDAGGAGERRFADPQTASRRSSGAGAVPAEGAGSHRGRAAPGLETAFEGRMGPAARAWAFPEFPGAIHRVTFADQRSSSCCFAFSAPLPFVLRR